jgi:murein DD-endopeptidase MepM/ murein hydrolase activator NlpD
VAIDPDLPTGFPLDPDSATDVVMGPRGSRVIKTRAGTTVREAAALQATDDATQANASGWNCRIHVEYEGSAAIDWYVPTGTPVYATTDGDAVLIVNTLANAFDFYGVDREPYIGDPDRARAPLNPFPGPGGGMGVYVAVIGAAFRTDYGHLAIASTLDAVPGSAFAEPYSPAFDYASAFATPQPFTFGVQVAHWPVRKGDVIGYTGDAGYSEAPHLHYVITERASGRSLCPTEESGFDDGGWLTG